jgi:competence protein ComEC
MFLVSVIAFVVGIYIQALHSIPLAISFTACAILLCLIPLALRRAENRATISILICFILAGMVRLGIVTENLPSLHFDEEVRVYEGMVIEASPKTKIMQLSNPEDVHGLRVIYRTEESLNISDRLKIFGNLKELTMNFKNPSTTSWKWLKRLEGISYEVKGKIISVREGKNYIETWRKFLAQRIDHSGTKYPGIIKALTIGDTSGLDEEIKALFLRTGTSHILAISGSNIGIVTAFFFFMARMFLRTSLLTRLRGNDKKYAALLSIPFAILFMLTAGSSIPTIRATIMISVYMLALYFERGRDVENTVALSALVILMIYPHSIFMPTFQLTFMSVFFIVLFTKTFYPYTQSWHPVVRWSFSSFLITISAMIGTFPIVLYHFYGINPIAVIHNLIAVPLMCVIAMPLSLIGLLIPYGDYLLRFSGEILSITIFILKHLDVGYIYPLIRPNLFEAVLFFLTIISLFFLRKRLFRMIFILILVPVLSFVLYTGVKERFYNNKLCLNFIDVGLGEAILVEAPQGMRMLIDGGGLYSNDFDMGKSIIAPILLSKKILSIDYVINTHPHGDHTGGLPYILNHFKVKHFVTGTRLASEPAYNKSIITAQNKQIPVEVWKQGDIFSFKNGLELNVLNPSGELPLENPNNRSLVFTIRYNKNSFLLTGDIESLIEESLLTLSRSHLRADVLKIPHHGSKYSSSLYFLNTVKPVLAVMSVGPGIRGIPSPETMERYQVSSIPILRTDKNGFIGICSDGNNISSCTQR